MATTVSRRGVVGGGIPYIPYHVHYILLGLSIYNYYKRKIYKREECITLCLNGYRWINPYLIPPLLYLCVSCRDEALAQPDSPRVSLLSTGLLCRLYRLYVCRLIRISCAKIALITRERMLTYSKCENSLFDTHHRRMTHYIQDNEIFIMRKERLKRVTQ